MGEQMRLDFTGFDAEAAQLDLLINPAVKGQGAIGIPGRQISGSVQARPRIRRQGIGDECAAVSSGWLR